MLFEVALRDVHPVRQEIPHHVPKSQIGQRTHKAHPGLKSRVIICIELPCEGLRSFGILAHLLVRFWVRRGAVLRPALWVIRPQKIAKVAEGEPTQGHAVHKLLLAPVTAALSRRHGASGLIDAGPITAPEQQNAVQLEPASWVSSGLAVVDRREALVVPLQKLIRESYQNGG